MNAALTQAIVHCMVSTMIWNIKEFFIEIVSSSKLEHLSEPGLERNTQIDCSVHSKHCFTNKNKLTKLVI